MPVIYGEPTGTLRTTTAPQVIGPFTFAASLAANTSTQSVAPTVTGNKQNNLLFNFIYSPLRLRGLTGYINANAVPSANTITFSVGAAASNYNGTETPAIVANTNLVVQGGFVGRITFAPPAPIGLPGVVNFTAAQGCVLGVFANATAAGNLDMAAYLHLEP